MIKKTAIGILIIFLGLIIYAALQPSQYHISREIKISAPQDIIFANVNDLKKFNEWNPWSKIDPTAKETYEGPTSGTGATYKWNGNNDVGSGIVTILKSDPNRSIQMKLEMLKPVSNSSEVEFTFKPENTETLVAWKIQGNSDFISKFLCIFINRDKLIGNEFEKGLKELKLKSEKK